MEPACFIHCLVVKVSACGFHSCKSIMYSVDFAEAEKLMREDSWKELDVIMANVAKRLEEARADIIVLCINTVHMCSHAIKKSISAHLILF